MKGTQSRHPALRALALILLGCYSFVFFQSQVIHPLAHSGHEHELHSQLAEADLCHQAIYHEAQQSCGHSTHIKAQHQECEWCDMLLTSQEVDDSLVEVNGSVQAASHINSSYISIFGHNHIVLQPNRGPPYLA